MKQSLKFILCFIFISVTVNNCQRKGTEPDYGNKYLLTETRAGMKIEPVWTELGDHLGENNKEMGLASVDVAEFSTNSTYVVSGASLGFDLIVWDVESGDKVWEYQCTDQIEVACFTPEDRYLIVGGKFNELHIWNVENWTINNKIELETSIETVKFSHNAKYFAAGLGNGKIILFNYPGFKEIETVVHTPEEKGYVIRNEYRADINGVDFSNDDKYLISGGMDGRLKLWKVDGMELVRTISGHNASVKSVKISPQSTCIASASTSQEGRPENSIKIWDFETSDLIHTLTFPLGMEAVEFTPDGKYLAGGGMEGKVLGKSTGEQGHIYFYTIPKDPVNQPIMQVHKEPVFRSEYLHFNRDGTMLVSSHEDGTVRLWNVIYLN